MNHTSVGLKTRGLLVLLLVGLFTLTGMAGSVTATADDGGTYSLCESKLDEPSLLASIIFSENSANTSADAVTLSYADVAKYAQPDNGGQYCYGRLSKSADNQQTPEGARLANHLRAMSAYGWFAPSPRTSESSPNWVTGVITNPSTDAGKSIHVLLGAASATSTIFQFSSGIIQLFSDTVGKLNVPDLLGLTPSKATTDGTWLNNLIKGAMSWVGLDGKSVRTFWYLSMLVMITALMVTAAIAYMSNSGGLSRNKGTMRVRELGVRMLVVVMLIPVSATILHSIDGFMPSKEDSNQVLNRFTGNFIVDTLEWAAKANLQPPPGVTFGDKFYPALSDNSFTPTTDNVISVSNMAGVSGNKAPTGDGKTIDQLSNDELKQNDPTLVLDEFRSGTTATVNDYFALLSKYGANPGIDGNKGAGSIGAFDITGGTISSGINGDPTPPFKFNANETYFFAKPDAKGEVASIKAQQANAKSLNDAQKQLRDKLVTPKVDAIINKAMNLSNPALELLKLLDYGNLGFKSGTEARAARINAMNQITSNGTFDGLEAAPEAKDLDLRHIGGKCTYDALDMTAGKYKGQPIEGVRTPNGPTFTEYGKGVKECQAQEGNKESTYHKLDPVQFAPQQTAMCISSDSSGERGNCALRFTKSEGGVMTIYAGTTQGFKSDTTPTNLHVVTLDAIEKAVRTEVTKAVTENMLTPEERKQLEDAGEKTKAEETAAQAESAGGVKIPVYGSEFTINRTAEPSALSPRQISASNPASYLYGAIPAGALDEYSKAATNYTYGQNNGLKTYSPEKGNEAETDSKRKESLKKNAIAVGVLNKFQGSSKGMSYQSVAFLLQSDITENSISYSGFNTASNEAGEAKNTGQNGNSFLRYTMPARSVGDMANKASVISIVFTVSAFLSIAVLIILLKAPVLSAIGRAFKTFFVALFTGNLAEALRYILYSLALKFAFVFSKMALYVAGMFGLIMAGDGDGLIATIGKASALSASTSLSWKAVLGRLLGLTVLGPVVFNILCLLMAGLLCIPFVKAGPGGQKVSIMGALINIPFNIADMASMKLSRIERVIHPSSNSTHKAVNDSAKLGGYKQAFMRGHNLLGSGASNKMRLAAALGSAGLVALPGGAVVAAGIQHASKLKTAKDIVSGLNGGGAGKPGKPGKPGAGTVGGSPANPLNTGSGVPSVVPAARTNIAGGDTNNSGDTNSDGDGSPNGTPQPGGPTNDIPDRESAGEVTPYSAERIDGTMGGDVEEHPTTGDSHYGNRPASEDVDAGEPVNVPVDGEAFPEPQPGDENNGGWEPEPVREPEWDGEPTREPDWNEDGSSRTETREPEPTPGSTPQPAHTTTPTAPTPTPRTRGGHAGKPQTPPVKTSDYKTKGTKPQTTNNSGGGKHAKKPKINTPDRIQRNADAASIFANAWDEWQGKQNM